MADISRETIRAKLRDNLLLAIDLQPFVSYEEGSDKLIINSTTNTDVGQYNLEDWNRLLVKDRLEGRIFQQITGSMTSDFGSSYGGPNKSRPGHSGIDFRPAANNTKLKTSSGENSNVERYPGCNFQRKLGQPYTMTFPYLTPRSLPGGGTDDSAVKSAQNKLTKARLLKNIILVRALYDGEVESVSWSRSRNSSSQTAYGGGKGWNITLKHTFGADAVDSRGTKLITSEWRVIYGHIAQNNSTLNNWAGVKSGSTSAPKKNYADNGLFLVSVGEKVKKGQPIAVLGTTGASSGPHVHLEIRRGSGKKLCDPASPTNPASFYSSGSIPYFNFNPMYSAEHAGSAAVNTYSLIAQINTDLAKLKENMNALKAQLTQDPEYTVYTDEFSEGEV